MSTLREPGLYVRAAGSIDEIEKGNNVMGCLKNALAALVFLSAAAALPACAAEFVIVENASAKAAIRPGDASRGAMYAAKELQKYVKAISGVELRILATNEVSASTILISNNRKGLRRDEISLAVSSDGSTLELSGEGPRGGINAVYELLERWGVRFFGVDPKSDKIPSKNTLSVPSDLSYSYAPPFEQRFPGSIALDRNVGPAWAVKLRVSREYAKIGGKRDAQIGGGHSLGNKYFINPQKHYDAHPEWYGLVGGKRMKGAQLCHSNMEMRKQLLEEVKVKLKARKDAGAFDRDGITYVSLSYLDSNQFCKCPECKKLLAEWGGARVGPLLDICNYVASGIEEEYPKARILTLAYWDWVEPPKKVPCELHRNVYVTICQNGNKALPVRVQEAPMRRLSEWSRIAPGRLTIWDWDACFRNYITPHPIYHLYADDFRTFRDLGVKRVSTQMEHGAVFADFVELRTYLYAKLLWNPDLDTDEMAKEWIDHCCGAGAVEINAYYKLLEKAVWGEEPKKRKTRARMHGYNPGRGWLNATNLAKSFMLFENALAKTSDDKYSHSNVRCLSAGMLMLVIERYDEVKAVFEDAKKSMNDASFENIKLPSRLDLVDRFEQIGKDFYIWCWREGPQPRDFKSLVKSLKEGTR